MASYHGVGVMSGTSLDGVDLCLALFTGDVNCDIWGYNIIEAETVPYTEEWRTRLSESTNLSGQELIKLHHDYGRFLGELVQTFLAKYSCRIDFVASHGHTVFHQPENGFTFQLGEGETMASCLGCPVICNFRAKDVALGGQGAPLAPSGERYLFHDTDLCLNLGGIANVGERGVGRGYDICPCNIVLNRLAARFNSELKYDTDGSIAAEGNVNDGLLNDLEKLEFYQRPPPKSLGIEWIQQNVFPLLDNSTLPIEDQMRTFVEHIVRRVTESCDQTEVKGMKSRSILVTGGGAFNTFLMGKLKASLAECKIIVQDTDAAVINFKEALIFAFLGLRGLLGLDNVDSRVTGASSDSCSGSLHRPYAPAPLHTKRHFRALGIHHDSNLG